MAPKNKPKPKPKPNSKPTDSAASASASAAKGAKLKPATAINVRHILCVKHAKKEEALERLRNGARFDEVAREMSGDKARMGGALGWKIRGSLLLEFEKVAYALEPSTTASPKLGEVKTGEGYHIIMVEGRR